MQYLSNINNSSLDPEIKEFATQQYNTLVNQGLDERSAYKQTLIEILNKNEMDLDELYKQLQNE